MLFRRVRGDCRFNGTAAVQFPCSRKFHFIVRHRTLRRSDPGRKFRRSNSPRITRRCRGRPAQKSAQITDSRSAPRQATRILLSKKFCLAPYYSNRRSRLGEILSLWPKSHLQCSECIATCAVKLDVTGPQDDYCLLSSSRFYWRFLMLAKNAATHRNAKFDAPPGQEISTS